MKPEIDMAKQLRNVMVLDQVDMAVFKNSTLREKEGRVFFHKAPITQQNRAEGLRLAVILPSGLDV